MTQGIENDYATFSYLGCNCSGHVASQLTFPSEQIFHRTDHLVPLLHTPTDICDLIFRDTDEIPFNVDNWESEFLPSAGAVTSQKTPPHTPSQHSGAVEEVKVGKLRWPIGDTHNSLLKHKTRCRATCLPHNSLVYNNRAHFAINMKYWQNSSLYC